MNRRQILQMTGALILTPILPKISQASIPWLTGSTMGTYFRVGITQVPEGLYLPKLKRRIEQVLALTESLMSTYLGASELSQFNTSASTHWRNISVHTARVVKAALTVQNNSRGAFNAASGPLINYWGFGAKRKIMPEVVVPPPSHLLNQVLEANIELDSKRLRKSHPQAALDLNAIAKGDAIDGIASVLEQFGIVDYLIEIGGEICAHGVNPEGSHWLIGLENPAGGLLTTIRLSDQAVATSGDYINYFTRNDKRYSHIIDPRTGNPVEHALTSVSIVADSAIVADAWATALLVMGLKDGLQYATQNALAVLFLQRHGDEYKAYRTSAFKQLI